MKKIILLSALLLLFRLSYGQDTLYLDNSFKNASKANATYFEIIKPIIDGFEDKLYTAQKVLLSDVSYKDKDLKVRNGLATNYYENGNKDSEGSYINNKRVGTWKFYFDSGKISAIAEFKNDKSVKESYYDILGKPVKDSTIAFHEPTFNGGIQAVYKYVGANFKYPKDLPTNIHGKLSVGFTITREGHIADVHISTSLNEKLDQEAIRVVSEMPYWIPGVLFNRPVDVRYLIPLSF